MINLFEHPVSRLQTWQNPAFDQAGIEVVVLRGDLFHPWIQGNKWYKLRHYARLAEQTGAVEIVSVGGPWSNHLLALSAWASASGLPCRFLIRGAEKEWENYPYIRRMRAFGAALAGISRSDFRLLTNKEKSPEECISNLNEKSVFVPLGASAPEVVPYVEDWAKHLTMLTSFTDIVLPVASGGTCAGLMAGLSPGTRVHGIDVLDSNGGLKRTIEDLLSSSHRQAAAGLCWHDAFAFGGYARKDKPLEDFTELCQGETGIPLEHVYSGKAFFAVSDLAGKSHFSRGSRVLLLHTGGIFHCY